MNNWKLRVLGGFILAIIGAFFIHHWLYPTLPTALTQDLPVSVAGQVQPTQNVEQVNQAQTEEAQSLQLMSVDTPTIDKSANTAQPQQVAVDPKLSTISPPAQVAPVLSNQPSPETVAQDSSSKEMPVLSNPDSKVVNAWVQAGSFGAMDNARKRVKTLQAHHWPTDIQKAKVGNKYYYRVYIGPISHSDVAQYLGDLKRMNIKDAREVSR